MSRISTAFFAAAVLYGLVGMAMGVVMGATHDHTLMPVHAHVNLLGWAGLALMGAFYGVAGARTPVRLAWTNFVVSNLGNLIVLPVLTMILLGTDPAKLGLAIAVGEILVVGGMVIFALAVVEVGRKPGLRTA